MLSTYWCFNNIMVTIFAKIVTEMVIMSEEIKDMEYIYIRGWMKFAVKVAISSNMASEWSYIKV